MRGREFPVSTFPARSSRQRDSIEKAERTTMARMGNGEKVGLQVGPVPGMPPRTKFVSRLMGYVAMAVGILVIAGWLLGVEFLKGIFPGLPAMNPLTAVAFILAGVSLRLLTIEPLEPAWTITC